MKRTFAEFEQMTKEEDLKPLPKFRYRGLDVMMAEGSRRPNEEMDVPHWMLVYAIGKDEYMDIGQWIRTPLWVETKYGPEVVNETERRKLITDAAKDWIDKGKKVGMY